MTTDRLAAPVAMTMSATGALQRALRQLGQYYRDGRTPTVRNLLGSLGAETSALGAALLALPFLSPVSLGPITTAASVLILLMGWGVLRRRSAALPERFLNLPVQQGMHRAMTAVLDRVAGWTHRFSRPRYPRLVDGRRGQIICGAGIILGALLLAVPIPLLPLTNTFPALGIVCFALGWSERDGLLTLYGFACLVLSALVFAALGTAVAILGWEAVSLLLPRLGGTP